MQRALGYDRDQRLAVFEAPSGAPFSEALADAPPRPRQAARLLKRLARALAPLHNAGAAHGALDATRILIDSLGHPTVLACGLGPVNPDATPASDVKDLVALVCGALRLDNTAAESLVDALASHLSQPEQSALRLMSSPRTGEELYAFADALEIAILKGELRG
jgi:tRNA A-37 threonylcarbamoyl transferase component Bud32